MITYFIFMFDDFASQVLDEFSLRLATCDLSFTISSFFPSSTSEVKRTLGEAYLYVMILQKDHCEDPKVVLTPIDF
jgi:hypothetical protein